MSTAGVVAVLQSMKQTLSEPKKWTKGVYARDKSGQDITASSPEACAFCMLGAYRKVQVGDGSDRLYALGLLSKEVHGRGHSNIPTFNDHYDTTHKDVIEVIDGAIASARKD